MIQPGGHIDEHDESIWQAAKREIEEEVGVDTVLHEWHNLSSQDRKSVV